MTVTFAKVGAQRKSWVIETDNLSDRNLIASIRQHRALNSQDINFGWNEAGDSATIFVGLVRPVGMLSVAGGRKA